MARRQLAALGLTAEQIYRRRRAGRLIALHGGVYALGHTALGERGRELAAVLACGPGALLSHRSAADLWGLLRTSSPRIEVTAPRGRKPRAGLVLHRSWVIEEEDRAAVEAVPVTSVARTLVDLADVVDVRRLARAVNEAELLRVFDLAAIDRVRRRLPRRRGRGRLASVLATYRPEPGFTRSGNERRLMRLCERHGLPRPQASLSVAGHEVDLLWADVGVVLELDGVEVHGTTWAFHEDRRRDRALAAAGMLVARVTARDLDDEAALARQLEEIRARRLRR